MEEEKREYKRSKEKEKQVMERRRPELEYKVSNIRSNFYVGLVMFLPSARSHWHVLFCSVILANARRSRPTTNSRRASLQRGRVPESTQPQTRQVPHLHSITHSRCQKSCWRLMFLSVLLSRPPPPTQHYENVNPSYAFADPYSPRPPSRPEAYKGSHRTNEA